MLINEVDGNAWAGGTVYITGWRTFHQTKRRYIGRYRTGQQRDVVLLLMEEMWIGESERWFRVHRKGKHLENLIARGPTVERVMSSVRGIGIMKELPPGIGEWIEDVISEVERC
jgi:hypothetical protein